MRILNERVLYVTYSPKNETVETKVKGLPFKYVRVTADDEEELNLFLQGLKEFSKINLYLTEEKIQNPNVQEEDEDNEEQPKKKKL